MADFKELWGSNQVQIVITGGDAISSRAVKRRGLKFSPSAAGDILVTREVGLDGEKSNWPITRLIAETTATVGCLFHDTVPVRIMVDMAKSVLSVPTNAIITFDYEP